MTLGEIIKEYRVKNDFTLEYIAKRCGITKGYVAMLEKNINSKNGKPLIPSLETIVKVSNGLNIEIDTMFDLLDDDTWVKINEKPLKTIYNKVLRDSSLDGLTNISLPAARPLPILGNICAGDGVFCEENYEGTFFVDNSIKADFCVRVHGDSMIDAGIFDNDMAFIRKNYDYEDGKIYAVRINSDCEAVLKKVILKDNTIVLTPCNSSAAYQPIIDTTDNISIIGECVGVYHSIKF